MSADREAAIRELRERARGYPSNAAIYAPEDVLPLLAELAAARRERDEWHIMAVNHGTQVEKLREALRRSTFLATRLMDMIDRDTWRAQGGDDGQGHYEGDYYAEQTAAEIRELTALADGEGET